MIRVSTATSTTEILQQPRQMKYARMPPFSPAEGSLPATSTTAPWFKGQRQPVCLPGRGLQVLQRFRKPLLLLLLVQRLPLELPLFLRRRAALVPLVREAVSRPVAHRGEAAAGAPEVHRGHLPDRPDTRRPQAGVEAATRTDALLVIVLVVLFILQCSAGFQASLLHFLSSARLRKNHSGVTDRRVPVAVHVTGGRISHDFTTLHSELLHRREHHHRGPQSAHGNFLLAAHFE